MSAEVWAVVVSIVALIISIQTSWKTSRESRRPIFVFEYNEEKGWQVRNVGPGPGMNVILAQGDVAAGKVRWKNPVRIPPLAKDNVFEIHWCRDDNRHALGVCYQDYAGKQYFSKCQSDLTTMPLDCEFPAWEEKDIHRHWGLADSRGSGTA
jgi:hypothetical protein